MTNTPDPIYRAAPEASKHRLFPFAEEISRELGPRDDDRDAQLAAARRSVAHRRNRRATVAAAAVAVAAGAVPAWEAAADGSWLAPWLPAALLAAALITTGLLGVRTRRLGNAVRAADATIGIPLPPKHIDAAMDGIVTLLVVIDRVPELPGPVRTRLYSVIGGAQYDYLVKLIAGARRVREAWATGDEQRWLAQSARFVDLCEEIDAFGDRVAATLRDLPD
ncbi:hypothetical protein ACFO4E_07360 [Nocardiopsis mangrovi]|uniref:Uncharacterized protein n=1 Tax=Nocardiopsis mangrovi TaxID=1179818 RepID=A0ABV9DRY6_9ACTN